MRIPTSMVAMEPERRRQRPETQGGNARLKGQALFRGVSTRGHGIPFPGELRKAESAPSGNETDRDKPKPHSKAELPWPYIFVVAVVVVNNSFNEKFTFHKIHPFKV